MNGEPIREANGTLIPDPRLIVGEMARLLKLDLQPGEHVELPRSITEGNGLYALLDHRYGPAGDAETVRRLGLVDDVVSCLQEKLIIAAANLGVTDWQLKALHDALQPHSFAGRPS